MRQIRSKLKCPKCGSRDLVMSEIYTGMFQWEQKNGIVDLDGGWDTSGRDFLKLRVSCKKCFHDWKPKNIDTVYDLDNSEN